MNLEERVTLLEQTLVALVASGGLGAPLPSPGPFRGNQHTGGFAGKTGNPIDPAAEKWAAYEKLHGRSAMIRERAKANKAAADG